MRAALRSAGRLFETGGPYDDASTADVFLRAARCVVLPYRDHDGSSGVMLQALAAGRPVLVPDEGSWATVSAASGSGRRTPTATRPTCGGLQGARAARA